MILNKIEYFILLFTNNLHIQIIRIPDKFVHKILVAALIVVYKFFISLFPFLLLHDENK